ncbi:hypothetical protein A0J61_04184 [Choanephora cucurbitarum]|uniref:Uncharacterized protein n=1 Tax=Choanephora cucurbitarum TaxID=101091 RepID=A0A1C7NKE9_9FUNG|nr:hypothetical protein A0J61_04184 [Choanephora cucurbitarum]
MEEIIGTLFTNGLLAFYLNTLFTAKMNVRFICENGKVSMRSPIEKNEDEVRAYRKHGDDVKEQLFFLVYEKAMTSGQTATVLVL